MTILVMMMISFEDNIQPFKLIQIWRPGGRHSLTQARLNHHLHCLDGQKQKKILADTKRSTESLLNQVE